MKIFVTLLIIAAVIALVVGGFFFFGKDKTEDEGTTESETVITSDEIEQDLSTVSTGSNEDSANEQGIKPQISAILSDVTGGTPVRGIDSSGSSGLAEALFAEGQYILIVNFEALPDPQGDDFYEGWVVRGAAESVISTGRLEKVNGQYVNNFQSTDDLTDHLKYVLTIEPNDGDPAPAGHILEGTFSQI